MRLPPKMPTTVRHRLSVDAALQRYFIQERAYITAEMEEKFKLAKVIAYDEATNVSHVLQITHVHHDRSGITIIVAK